MTTVDVSPDGLREAGRILNEARETLVTGSNAHLRHGLGDDQHISTGGFPTGAFAQQQLGILYGQAQQTLHNVVNNVASGGGITTCSGDIVRSCSCSPRTPVVGHQ